MSSQAVRRLALLAMLGGATYMLTGVAQLASPEQTDPFSRASDYLIQILLALSFLLTLAGFAALNLLLQAGGYRGPRDGRAFARPSSGRPQCSRPRRRPSWRADRP